MTENTERKPTILVCGFGRCGSSLVMQMLHKAGLECSGLPPAFEDTRTTEPPSPERTQMFHNYEAIKVLDPHRFPPPQGNYTVLWLERDHVQQAKSQLKFLRLMFPTGQIPRGSQAVDAMAKSYYRDKSAAINALKRAGARAMHELNFESLINLPDFMAGLICDACGLSRLKAAEMASVVIRRTPECQPGLDIEMQLVTLDLQERKNG